MAGWWNLPQNAIILVHNLEHFIFPVYPTEQPAWLAVLNDGVFNIIFSLFAGKAYAIFALLFGFTFYIQCHNQEKKGKDFGYRFLWRLVLLLGFATLNARANDPFAEVCSGLRIPLPRKSVLPPARRHP